MAPQSMSSSMSRMSIAVFASAKQSVVSSLSMAKASSLIAISPPTPHHPSYKDIIQ